MKTCNIIQIKSYEFALKIVRLCWFVMNERKEFILSKQLMRSGTSIGANVEEAIGAQSKKDFISKIGIAYKEARETTYWIKIMKDTGLINNLFAQELLKDADEMRKILAQIQKTLTQNNNS